MPNFQTLTHELLHMGSRRYSLGIGMRRYTSLFLGTPVLFGFSIFLLRAKSNFVEGFSFLTSELYVDYDSHRHHVVEHSTEHNRRVLPAMLA